MRGEAELVEIQALMRLLDEPDNAIYEEIARKIRSYGSEIIPFLENEWEKTYDDDIQSRIRSLIHVIHSGSIKEELKLWVDDGCKDLLVGCLIIARYQYPDLSEDSVYRDISRIRKDAWLEINDQLTALEQIKVMNHVFYELHGFTGNSKEYHSPDNSFINKVLETHRGSPLSLGIIYMLIAQSIDIPVFGVNLPDHFMLLYANTHIHDDEKVGIQDGLFYINAFNHGTLYSRDEIVKFAKYFGYEPHASFFKPCSNNDIIRRMLNNLAIAYKQRGDGRRSKDMESFHAMLISPKLP